MRFTIALLLSLIISITLKAQQSPPESYSEFPKFELNGGDFIGYIADNLKYSTPINQDLRKILTITILIDSTGKASVYNIPQKVSPDVDAAFTKSIARAPKLIPANLKGKPVSVYFTIRYGIDLIKVSGKMIIDSDMDSGFDKIYTAAQVNPAFPGGEIAFSKFLSQNIQYPQLAKEKGVSGRAFIQFVVERDGSLSNMKILRDPGMGLGEEAVRILNLSPKWTPATQFGEPVRMQYTIPVSFSL